MTENLSLSATLIRSNDEFRAGLTRGHKIILNKTFRSKSAASRVMIKGFLHGIKPTKTVSQIRTLRAI